MPMTILNAWGEGHLSTERLHSTPMIMVGTLGHKVVGEFNCKKATPNAMTMSYTLGGGHLSAKNSCLMSMTMPCQWPTDVNGPHPCNCLCSFKKMSPHAIRHRHGCRHGVGVDMGVGVGAGHGYFAWALDVGVDVGVGHAQCLCPHTTPISNANTQSQHTMPTSMPNTHTQHPHPTPKTHTQNPHTTPMPNTHAQCPQPTPIPNANT